MLKYRMEGTVSGAAISVVLILASSCSSPGRDFGDGSSGGVSGSASGGNGAAGAHAGSAGSPVTGGTSGSGGTDATTVGGTGGVGGSLGGSGGVSAGFTVEVANRVVVEQGDAENVRVTVTRTSDQGAIKFKISGLPQGVTGSEFALPALATDFTLKVTAAPDAPQVNPATITINAVGDSGTLDVPVALVVRGESGSPDLSFGTGGFKVIDAMFSSGLRASAGPNGVLVAGSVVGSQMPNIVQLTRTGDLDLSFGTKGFVIVPVTDRGHPLAAPRIDAQGRWLVRYAGFGTGSAARINANGVLDNTFSTDGFVEMPFSTGNDGAIVPIPNGGYWAGSSNSSSHGQKAYVLRKFSENGDVLGTDVTTHGIVEGVPKSGERPPKVLFEYADNNDKLCDLSDLGSTQNCIPLLEAEKRRLVALEAGDKNRVVALFSGSASDAPLVVRFGADARDTTFGTANGQRAIVVPDATSPSVYGLFVIDDASQTEIYVVGQALFGTDRRTFVAELTQSGSFHPIFGKNGFATVDVPELQKESGTQLWVDGENIYVLLLSTDAAEPSTLKNKLHVARLWR